MSSAAPAESLPKIWREVECWLLVLFVVLSFGLRLGDLTIRGEETRRALIAREMLDSGDWLVPRTQGQPLLSRPPLQNWIIAGISLVQGRIDEWTVRLPSVLSILATALLVYAYGRSFLSKLGAFASGMVFASLGQVIELGRFGETDAMFTLFVAGSLLVWHLGFLRNWNPYLTWCLGYGLAALGTLTKGPQAPVYFVSIVGMTLLIKWRAGYAFKLAHLAGIALFAVLVGAWQIPFMKTLGSDAGGDIYVADVGHRFLDATWGTFLEHFAEYPLELLACLLPWSALFIVWNRPGFRQSLSGKWPQVGFQITAILVAFPSVWLPPGSRPRYFMSLYPCVALLLGATIDRLAFAAADAEWRRIWPWFLRGCSVAIGAVGIAILGVSVVDAGVWFAQPIAFAWVYCTATSLASALLWRLLTDWREPAFRAAIVTIAGFVALTQVGVMINAHLSTTPNTIAAVQELKELLPPGTRLVSMNMAHHMFVFHYGEVPFVKWPESEYDVPNDLDFFCVDARELDGKKLPFEWKEVFVVPCTKHKVQLYQLRMIIGQRISRQPAADDAMASAEIELE